MKENIKVRGYVGTWYEIAKMIGTPHGTIYLMEHEEFGDEAAHIIIDENDNLIMDEVYNDFDDYFDEFA